MAIKRVHLLPNVITAFGLSCGLFVIFRMTMTPLGEATEQQMVQIAGIMLLAAIADVLDGALARAMKAESEFGGLFDSLSDAVTFGVAPSVILLKTLSLQPGTLLSFWLTTAAMLFSVSGVLRLVRFNVMAHEEKKEEALATKVSNNKKYFTGLPIPAAAATAISANLFLASQDFPKSLFSSEQARAIVLIFVLVFLGYLMVSRWKFPSVKSLHIRVTSFNVLLLTVVTAAFIFYGILNHFPLFFFVISWGYLLLSLAWAVYRRFFGASSEAEDNEEDEEIDELL